VEDITLSYPKTAKRFSRNFPSATDLRWIKEGNVLFAYFFNSGHKSYAVFTLRGSMIYAVTYLESTDLPPGILKKISNDYSAYSIFNLKQIMICGYSLYRVIMENNSEFIHVQTDGTEIEEIERLNKSLSREGDVNR
jgi:uncharacterized protein YxeA